MIPPSQNFLRDAIGGLRGEELPPENIERIRTLLDNGADVNSRDENGMTALMDAAFLRRTATVQLLLDRGADVHLKDTSWILTQHWHGLEVPTFIGGRTALQYAFNVDDDTTILRLLLDRGADVNVRDGNEGTLLISAAGSGTVETIRLLLAYHADVHLRDEWGRTALRQARVNGYDEIIALLIQAGAIE